MPTIRRLYLYTVAAVGLALLLGGLCGLLDLALSHLLLPAPGSSAEPVAEQLSRWLALALVGLPLWLVHWWLIGRSVRADGEGADGGERASTARAVYFTVILAVTLTVLAWTGRDLLTGLLGLALDAGRRWRRDDAAWGFSIVVIAATAWALHARWRWSDLRMEPARLAGDRLTRLYLYGVLLLAGTAVLYAAARLVLLSARLILPPPLAPDGGWWQRSIASLGAVALAAGAAWIVHWLLAGGLLTAPEPMSGAHRASRTRVAYLLGIGLVAAGATAWAISTGLAAALGWLAGVSGSRDPARRVEDILAPLLATIPLIAAWWWHARRATREAFVEGGTERRAAVHRLAVIVPALVGLACFAVGGTQLLRMVIDVIGDSDTAVALRLSSWRSEVAEHAALAITGLLLWLPAWRHLQGLRAAEPGVEATSTGRRAYLVLVSGIAVVAAGCALAWLVYESLRVVLAVSDTMRGDVSGVLAVLLVAVPGLVYHGAVLHADLRLGADLRAGAAAPPGEPETSTVLEHLDLCGPSGADLDALNARLRAQLPSGYTLRVALTPPARPASNG